MRKSIKKQFILTERLKTNLLQWAQQFDEIVWLDSNHHKQKYSNYKAILAVDAFTSIKTDSIDAFLKLEEYQANTKDWLFGYFTYDLKNDVEKMSSSNYDGLNFPDLQFFQPKRLFLFSENEVEILYLNFVADELENDWNEITGLCEQFSENNSEKLRGNLMNSQNSPIKIHLHTSKDSYFEKLDTILKHIHRGDIYEMNFCQEFYSENAKIDPITTYLHLNEISEASFTTFLKMENHFALSASPERYICKTGNKIISQPIKGTAKRSKDKIKDEKLKIALEKDPKERSENIMIVDLVRNDLSRFAEKGTVIVEELCKVYTFQQVHQMISTIVCEVSDEISPISILKNTFPMGSMTGAPKISAMQIIEKLEDAKRGLYSGAVGYFTPNNDFDFNVIIRSILYNASNQYVSFSVGGAITALSIPAKEYEECLIKAKAMREALS